ARKGVPGRVVRAALEPPTSVPTRQEGQATARPRTRTRGLGSLASRWAWTVLKGRVSRRERSGCCERFHCSAWFQFEAQRCAVRIWVLFIKGPRRQDSVLRAGAEVGGTSSQWLDWPEDPAAAACDSESERPGAGMPPGHARQAGLPQRIRTPALEAVSEF